jgi:hypothetical protein
MVAADNDGNARKRLQPGGHNAAVTPKRAEPAAHESISLLRQELVQRPTARNPRAKVAAEANIFCRGFARYTDLELRRRYDWIARRNPKMKRQVALEEIADRWQMARQDVDQLPTACDVQQKVHDACRGWDDFSDDELARFYYEMTGKDLVVP